MAMAMAMMIMMPRSTRSQNLSSLPLRPVSGKGRGESKKITDDDLTEQSGTRHSWEASTEERACLSSEYTTFS